MRTPSKLDLVIGKHVRHRYCDGKMEKWLDVWECSLCQYTLDQSIIDALDEGDLGSLLYVDGPAFAGRPEVLVWAEEGGKRFLKLVHPDDAGKFERYVFPA